MLAENVEPTYRLHLVEDGNSESHIIELQNGSYLSITPSAFYLLKAVNNGTTFDEIAEQLTISQSKEVYREEVENAYYHLNAQFEEINQQPREIMPELWFHKTLLSSEHVNSISRFLTFLFNPIVVIGMFCLLLYSLVSQWEIIHSFWSNTSGISNPIGVYFFVVVSLLFHELGHSSASLYYKVKAHSIGFGIYWIYTIFYADVTHVWRLNRNQRIVVNLGGIYFQIITIIIGIWLYVWLGWVSIPASVVWISLSIFLNLNPLLKFDGYWIVSDFIGVANLSKQPGIIIQHIWGRLTRKPTDPLPWSNFITGFLIIYSILVVCFWVSIIISILPMLLNHLIWFPAIIRGFIRDLSTSPYRLADGRISSLFTSVLVIGLIGSLCANTLKKFMNR